MGAGKKISLKDLLPKKIHAMRASGDGSDKFPDISKPVEFKNAPLTFVLHVNGREETAAGIGFV